MPVNPETVLDHYLCYPIDNEGFEPPKNIQVADQFLDGRKRKITVIKRHSLWMPVKKNHKAPPFPEAHLVCYEVKESGSIDKWVRISNQFDFETQEADQTFKVKKLFGRCEPFSVLHVRRMAAQRISGASQGITVTVHKLM